MSIKFNLNGEIFLDNSIDLSEKGAANGVVPLGDDAKINSQYLPDNITANILLKQGTTSEIELNPPLANEPVFDLTSQTLYVGSTPYAKRSDLSSGDLQINIINGSIFQSDTTLTLAGGLTILEKGKNNYLFLYRGISGTLSITDNNCTSIESNLEFTTASIILGNLSNFQNLLFSDLVYVGTSFNIDTIPNIISLSFPKLKYVKTTLSIFNNSLLTTLNLPELVDVNDIDCSGNTSLTNVTLGNTLKSVRGTIVTFSGCALNQPSVDNILVRLAALDGTGYTTVFGTGKTLNLAGGTNSIPSATGLAAKATLVGRGVTVTHN